MQFGIVMVLGRLFMQPGLAMGSGLAAGGASLAAEMLHTNNHRFPHKKDELADALLALDDEITVHEIQAQQGKSEELADWLNAAGKEMAPAAP